MLADAVLEHFVEKAELREVPFTTIRGKFDLGKQGLVIRDNVDDGLIPTPSIRLEVLPRSDNVRLILTRRLGG